MQADLVIRGGTVIDGTGRPGRRADVAVRDGRIAAIGEGLSARRDLDARGRVVCPGFIDIHTHYDAQVFWDRALTPSSFHGVTTVIAGNCGFSIAPTRPQHRRLTAETLEHVEDMNLETLLAGIVWEFETFPDYLEAVRRRGTLINFGAYIGHSALRLYVMGEAGYERAAHAEEIERMARLVAEAMEAGAAGFSSSFGESQVGAGGRPVPSRRADIAEFESLARSSARSRRGVVMLNAGNRFPPDYLYALQKELQVPITTVALVSHPTGLHLQQLQAARRGWADGADVWPQVSPLPIVHEVSMAKPGIFNSNPVISELSARSFAERRAAYADPAWRARALAAFPTRAPLAPRWNTYKVNRSSAHPGLEGRMIERLAAERGRAILDVILDLALDEPDLRFTFLATVVNDDVEAVTGLLREAHCAIGLSDAGAHATQHCEAMQATAFLGEWVRERRVMPLEAAVRKLTGVQADLLGIPDRGYLRPGARADIVVFDPDTVAPGPIRRVRDFPAGGERFTADQPVGVSHVLVNGTPIRMNGSSNPLAPDGFPGHIVRVGRRAPQRA